MFKRLFAVFLLAGLMVGSAYAADHVLPHIVTQDLLWHTSLGDAFTYSQGDSIWRYRGTGIQASAEQKDTTKAVTWADWALPLALHGSVTADTVGVLILDIYPDGTSPTVAADTLDIFTQVSDDNGTTWTTLANTGPAISPDAATMTAVARLETGSSNSFHHVVRAQVGGVANGGPFSILQTGSPTANQTYGYQLIRWIIEGDHTGKYRIKLTGWKNAD